MSTRAQIGIYESDDLSQAPVSLIGRQHDGHPTGASGVCPMLAEYIPSIVARRGTYDAPYLAAQFVHAIVQESGRTGIYELSPKLYDDIRFYYAVTPTGMFCFDARELAVVDDVAHTKPMFFTAWVEPERVQAVEKEVETLEHQLADKKLELEGMRRKQLRRGR